MEKREEYLSRAERELAELSTKLEGLKSEAAKLTDAGRARLGATVDRAAELQAAFKTRVDQLRGMTTDAWADLREGLGKAGADLKEAVDHAAGEFKRSSPPGSRQEGEQPTLSSTPKQTTLR